ncbi:hypothetical protein EVAR_60194_1 [Eumeta japonica]|uniref:Uncharacterized protein n=1 Tax=Eumeta variegata TaxID=151549 RepID=A0A4C1Z965_EUMVA|nr:hypothetical protein EVAR_60194_1 [Eumeta japonica]
MPHPPDTRDACRTGHKVEVASARAGPTAPTLRLTAYIYKSRDRLAQAECSAHDAMRIPDSSLTLPPFFFFHPSAFP